MNLVSVPMPLFSAAHFRWLIYALLVTLILIWIIAPWQTSAYFALFGGLCLAHEIAKPFYRHYWFGEPAHAVWPLQLCHLVQFLWGVGFLFGWQWALELALIWSLIGAIPALIFPGVNKSMPDAQSTAFALTHALMIVGFAMFLLSPHLTLSPGAPLQAAGISLLICVGMIPLHAILPAQSNYWLVRGIPLDLNAAGLAWLPTPPWHLALLIPLGCTLVWIIGLGLARIGIGG